MNEPRSRTTSLAEVLKHARGKLKWTQEDLARAVKQSRSLIAQLERGSFPSRSLVENLFSVLPEVDAEAVRQTPEVRRLFKSDLAYDQDGFGDDMIHILMSSRRSREVDLAGEWSAMWLTTVNGEENRNREVIEVRRRWNSTWEFKNKDISEDNPDGGYLWVARMDLLDSKHILGNYCAREHSVLAKGTLCLELQSNGREIYGVWNGLNFDTMWAHGLVAMCRLGGRTADPGTALDRFISTRPKMPY
jgi:transcriptional regulator with XRE-family HTH domain